MNRQSVTPSGEFAANGQFATTRWSLVVAAGGGDERATLALGQLCELYWEPVYVYLRRRGQSPDDAADLAQGFFARLLEKGHVGSPNPDRGRFRGFLLGALKHFVSNERDKEQAIKRGGGAFIVSLDIETAEGRYLNEPVDTETPETAFLRRWALGLIEGVFQQLKSRYHAEGKGLVFDELAPHLTSDPEACTYKEIGTRLGLTENAVKVASHRLRERYRDLVRTSVAETVNDPADIDDEIRFLLTALER
jgi:DNA-directed RNA polymerase specialized sigma24 family protein